ncbi:ABC transporter permease [Streptomyces acidicola]|uniref:ABC transporter permease n=1 Tax=Streptomyces acidicola TaxID=2596892 RepID=UPI003824B2B7
MRLATRIALGAAAPVVVIAGYGIVTSASPDPFFPPIPVILDRFAQLWLFARVGTDAVPSLVNFAAGFALAVAVGVPVGVLFGQIRWLGEMMLPLMDFARSVPPIMLIPPLVLVLGVGDTSKIAIIFLGAFFPIVVSTLDGLRRTDPALVDMARSIQLGPATTVLRLYVPSAAPAIFGGMQTGLQFALVLMVSSEMVAAVRGLGFVTMQAQATFNAPSVWAGILLLALLGFLINVLFTLVRNRVLAWHIGLRATLKSR